MKKKISIIVCLFTFLSFVVTGCGQKETSTRNVTIAYNPNAYASAVSQIMKTENILEKYLPEDVEVEWVEMSSASDIRDALAAGTLDIATPALTAYITASENNLPIKLISNYGNAQVALYGCDGIKDITDFSSEDVIAIKGLNTNPHIAMLAYCKENGLDLQMYNKILNKIPEAETIGMLSTGTDIEGAVLSYPMTKEADALANCKKLIDFADVIKEYNLGTVVCVNTDFYENNEDLVNAFEKAHKSIVNNWKEALESNAAIPAEQYGCSVEEVKGFMTELPPTMEITGYDKLANLMYECEMIEEAPKLYADIK